MARNLFQTVDFTCLATQKVAGLCDNLSQSAQKGTITRLWDFSPVFVVALGVVLALALALGACLVWLALDERREARLRNKVRNDYVHARPLTTTSIWQGPHTLVECPQTRNIKGNR